MTKTSDSHALRRQLAERSAQLQGAAAQLKQELFGIDDVIDQVIDSMRAWYVLPQLITRPVVICLWGLTGTGKTQLVRRLAQLLGFYDRFVEVQMDGFSHGASRWEGGTISGMLSQSGVTEGAPGILVLDEFQRFRTMDAQRKDVRVERYQDVWALLSDGRLPPALSLLGEIEASLASAAYDAEQDDGEDEDERRKARERKLKLAPWQARELKSTLKLAEPLVDIMRWTPEDVQARLRAFRESAQGWETDYSQLLVFVCGNLDEMYSDLATRVEDCDTDADVFHALTRKLSVIDVKKALAERFKPEQIARLGNNHLVYASLSRTTYERLIRQACAGYVEQTQASSGVRIELDEAVYGLIYANAVFPAQGTRPLFSSIHAMLSATLVNAALWALESDVLPHESVHIGPDPSGTRLVARLRDNARLFAVAIDLDRARRGTSEDFRALLAVHEAGHGLAYALLFGRAPLEIKINVASFEGGYNSYAPRKAWSRRNLLDSICVSLAGRAAERLVFGDDWVTSGGEGDLRKATATAARCVRHLGFGPRLSRTDVASNPDEHLNTALDETNVAIESLLREQQSRADALLGGHAQELLRLVDELLCHGSIPPERFAGLLGIADGPTTEPVNDYARRLEGFRRRPVGGASGPPGKPGSRRKPAGLPFRPSGYRPFMDNS